MLWCHHLTAEWLWPRLASSPLLTGNICVLQASFSTSSFWSITSIMFAWIMYSTNILEWLLYARHCARLWRDICLQDFSNKMADVTTQWMITKDLLSCNCNEWWNEKSHASPPACQRRRKKRHWRVRETLERDIRQNQQVVQNHCEIRGEIVLRQ